MVDEVSAKNTKNEILEAYHVALEQLKDARKFNKQEIKNAVDKKEIVSKASDHSTEEIVKQISALKLTLVRALEDIEEQLLISYKQLITLQQAIDIQSKELTDLHEIKVNANSLSALLYAQKEKTNAFDKEMKDRTLIFEQEMAVKRNTWKKEQEEVEFARKEYEQQAKKLRQREEEEYIYQRDLKRKKEKDQYTAEKESLDKELSSRRSALEQEFSNREATLNAQEQEFNTLKQQAEQFPVELQKAITDTTNQLTEKLTFKFEYETKLMQKEVEGERKLFKQMIAALESKVANLEAQAKQLSDKTNQANLQVQDIAVKAIESASIQRFVGYSNEKSVETTTKQQ